MSQQSPKQFVARSQSDDVSKACMAEMIARLELILALDGLERFATERSLPAAFFSEYTAALDAYDRYIAHIIAAEPLAVTCKAGCDACCRHELARGVTPVEILAIYRLVRPWEDIGSVYAAAGESAVAFQRLLKEALEADPERWPPVTTPASSPHICATTSSSVPVLFSIRTTASVASIRFGPWSAAGSTTCHRRIGACPHIPTIANGMRWGSTLTVRSTA